MKTTIKKLILRKVEQGKGRAVIKFTYNDVPLCCVINVENKIVVLYQRDHNRKEIFMSKCKDGDVFDVIKGVELSLYRFMRHVIHEGNCELRQQKTALRNFERDIESRFAHVKDLTHKSKRPQSLRDLVNGI